MNYSNYCREFIVKQLRNSFVLWQFECQNIILQQEGEKGNAAPKTQCDHVSRWQPTPCTMNRYGSTGPTSKQAYGAATQNTENRPTLLHQQVALNSQTSGSQKNAQAPMFHLDL